MFIRIQLTFFIQFIHNNFRRMRHMKFKCFHGIPTKLEVGVVLFPAVAKCFHLCGKKGPFRIYCAADVAQLCFCFLCYTQCAFLYLECFGHAMQESQVLFVSEDVVNSSTASSLP